MVVSTWVLEHVADPKNYVREAFRVLRRNGKFICAVPSFIVNTILHLIITDLLTQHSHNWPTQQVLGPRGFNPLVGHRSFAVPVWSSH